MELVHHPNHGSPFAILSRYVLEKRRPSYPRRSRRLRHTSICLARSVATPGLHFDSSAGPSSAGNRPSAAELVSASESNLSRLQQDLERQFPQVLRYPHTTTCSGHVLQRFVQSAAKAPDPFRSQSTWFGLIATRIDRLDAIFQHPDDLAKAMCVQAANHAGVFAPIPEREFLRTVPRVHQKVSRSTEFLLARSRGALRIFGTAPEGFASWTRGRKRCKSSERSARAYPLLFGLSSHV